MIGNDIVDLRDADARPGARHPRFDARVFCAAERAALAASSAPDRLRWVFWAAKEAAYKVARKLDAACVFSPSLFAVEFESASLGTVDFGQARFPVHVNDVHHGVHVVATQPSARRSRIVTGSREMTDAASRDAAAPGLAVRELALSQLSSCWPDSRVLAVAQEGRIPVLESDGVRVDADLSLSHHGRWVAFACEIPQNAELA
ncbi:MAG: 4'-phosphopantetheinyl transferase superfamily protein [Myxococcales bacterium]|nr:4'-phosphopantetheinyl transferase superfamily protein [Myxococcales bacterium]